MLPPLWLVAISSLYEVCISIGRQVTTVLLVDKTSYSIPEAPPLSPLDRVLLQMWDACKQQQLTSSFVAWSRSMPSLFLYRLPGTWRNCTLISARLVCKAFPAFSRKGTPSHRGLSMKHATAAKVGHKLQHITEPMSVSQCIVAGVMSAIDPTLISHGERRCQLSTS